MDEVFTSTYWAGSARNMLINNERILYIEREQSERVFYVVTFDNGQKLELDEGTGKALYEHLGQLDRPRPPMQYVSSERSGRYPNRLPPCPPRRRADGPL